MITIISKDNVRINISKQIVDLAKGLEPYLIDQDIVFEDIVTGDFLQALKLFYEEFQFDIEKMKFPKPMQLKENEKVFGKVLLDHFKPFLDIAIRDKNIDIFIQFIRGAHLFQAKHFIEFINCCLAMTIQFKGQSEYDIKQFQKDWNLSDSYQESSFNQIFFQKLQNKYIQALSTKDGEQQVQQQVEFDEDVFSDGW
ncbi:unnamed protein product (macronuclear) [Paramecium tetraurelia]|uniref:Uncharacterized protein n=1 Tax=Paramecium tetraurelia TaxID=5888 RepID=A0BCG1_PARTE|nr:uncharacterized protein GSPATT00004322001 [Paramecium tetraurelia]CAK56228.1 unnamed protein product [Paramecium tetraurelia]|eukprot:XP_001423626.1 hypothetical protein (macronuclear) [Paramecium tetraurelia strain d4-2]